MRDAIEPVSNLFSGSNGASLSDEHKKRRLKSILRIVMVLKGTTADTPDHWGETPHQRFDGRVFAMVDEARKQLPVRRVSFSLATGNIVQ